MLTTTNYLYHTPDKSLYWIAEFSPPAPDSSENTVTDDHISLQPLKKTEDSLSDASLSDLAELHASGQLLAVPDQIVHSPSEIVAEYTAIQADRVDSRTVDDTDTPSPIDAIDCVTCADHLAIAHDLTSSGPAPKRHFTSGADVDGWLVATLDDHREKFYQFHLDEQLSLNSAVSAILADADALQTVMVDSLLKYLPDETITQVRAEESDNQRSEIVVAFQAAVIRAADLIAHGNTGLKPREAAVASQQ